MNTRKKILIAFILNICFSMFEFWGGLFTGSTAITSDALHDMGDAVSIGISYFLEKRSGSQPDHTHTYGYARYSLLGGVITTVVLLLGSAAVIVNAVQKIINPSDINYNGMLVFALVGVAVNFAAAFFTHGGNSVNQRAVNLHMLEDVLGWVVVLIGATVMRFTDFRLLDPVMSIGVAIFILINASKNLKEIIDIFLEKTPKGVSVDQIKDLLCKIEGVKDVHHIHLRTIDGNNIDAAMHIVTDSNNHTIKSLVRKELLHLGVTHSTLELETSDEHCHDIHCHIENKIKPCCHHH